MSELLQFFKDMRDNGYGLAEIAAQLGTSAIAEPVAGFAAMYDPVHGADAIREGMTYQPRSQAAQEYSQSVGNAAKTAIKPAMPIIDAWQQGVDIAGRYSPVVGAGLRTVPTAIGIAMGAKPALQAGRQVSNSLGAMQGRMIANANAPRTLNTGFRGQRGTFAGINALTADKEALAKAKAMIAQGVDPEDVWKETGWGRGADGKWRFEIDDSKARLRDYQFTPKDAYEYAKRNAFISGDEQMINRAKSMGEYASMTKAQLRDEYKRTGNEIVDAAINGDIEKAKLLSEKRSGLDSLLSQMSNREYGKASSFIAHGDLGQAYPDAYKIHTRISPKDVGTASAHYNKGNDFQSERIVMGRKPIFESDKSTMLHELQHAIQQREGFARGGNPEQFKGIVKDPYEWYRRLAGEVEARMTQNRMNLDAQQRRDIYPFAVGRYGYEDIPKDKQIINFDNNKAMSQKPLTEFEQAHATAQRNAALPVSQGGLGLAPDNTAMDRARAMGFDVDTTYTHRSRTPNYIQEINPKGEYSGLFSLANDDAGVNYGNNKHEFLLKGDIATNIADEYSDALLKKNLKEIVGHKSSTKISSNDMDTIRYALDNQTMFMNEPDRLYELFNSFDDVDSFVAIQKTLGELSRKKGYGAVKMEDEFGDSTMLLHGNKVRYKDAAFDPKKAKSSNLLAKTAPLVPTTALGAYMYNENRKKSQGNQ